MKLDLKKLKDAPARAFPVTGSLSLDSLIYKGRPLRLKDKIHLNGEATYRSGAVYLAMQLKSLIELECSRCLKRFTAPIVIEETLEFREEARGEAALAPAEGFTYEAGTQELELLTYLKNLMLIRLDPKPLCKADCKGLCQYCGKDLNEGPCSCEARQGRHLIDPRLEKLKEFFK